MSTNPQPSVPQNGIQPPVQPANPENKNVKDAIFSLCVLSYRIFTLAPEGNLYSKLVNELYHKSKSLQKRCNMTPFIHINQERFVLSIIIHLPVLQYHLKTLGNGPPTIEASEQMGLQIMTVSEKIDDCIKDLQVEPIMLESLKCLQFQRRTVISMTRLGFISTVIGIVSCCGWSVYISFNVGSTFLTLGAMALIPGVRTIVSTGNFSELKEQYSYTRLIEKIDKESRCKQDPESNEAWVKLEGYDLGNILALDGPPPHERSPISLGETACLLVKNSRDFRFASRLTPLVEFAGLRL